MYASDCIEGGHALRVQAQAAATAEGASQLPGVSYSKRRGVWTVRPLSRWNVQPRYAHWVASSRAGAESIQAMSFPRLEAAAAEGRADEEYVLVREELHEQVRRGAPLRCAPALDLVYRV